MVLHMMHMCDVHVVLFPAAARVLWVCADQ